MPEEHPNVSILRRFNPADVAGTAGVFAEDVVWHYFNPALPEIHGDYVGRAGVQTFFERVAQRTGTFEISPISVTVVGDELLVAHNQNTLTMQGRKIETDVVVVFRVVEGHIAEVWDIPSVYRAKESPA